MWTNYKGYFSCLKFGLLSTNPQRISDLGRHLAKIKVKKKSEENTGLNRKELTGDGENFLTKHYTILSFIKEVVIRKIKSRSCSEYTAKFFVM
jgi:hypothetical protein